MSQTNALLSKPDPNRAERRWALALFVLTCITVFAVRLFRWQPEVTIPFWEAVGSSALFAVALMGILVAHEMGHFWAAKVHRFSISLPWFLPFPLLIGTLGALIRFRDKPPNRGALLEMAAAGPLSGMATVILVLVGWMSLGPHVPTNDDGLELAVPGVFYVVHYLIDGNAPVGVSAYDPLGFAAWIGCLITSINLLPFGQLDGGHIVFALFPSKARIIGWLVTGLLLVGGIFWVGWLFWVVALHLIGSRHPVDVRHKDGTANTNGKIASGLCVLVWLLCFTPIPVHLVS